MLGNHLCIHLARAKKGDEPREPARQWLRKCIIFAENPVLQPVLASLAHPLGFWGFRLIGECPLFYIIDSNLVQGKINAYTQLLVTESKLPWLVPTWVIRTEWRSKTTLFVTRVDLCGQFSRL